jgi:hypothetical protein
MTSLHEATGIREFTEGVSFCAFRQLAARRGWSVEGVLALLARHGADDFGGPRSSPYYESPRRYLARVLDGRASRDTDELVIPYRGLIALYVAARVHEGPRAPGDAVCCGCGRAVTGRRRYASGTCRVRALRQRRVSNVPDKPDRLRNPHAPQGLFRYIRARQIDSSSCNTLLAQIGPDALAADRRAHAGASFSRPLPAEDVCELAAGAEGVAVAEGAADGTPESYPPTPAGDEDAPRA